MARYIDADIAVKEAIKACNKLFRENGTFLTSIDAVDIAEALDEIPAADVVKVKHGEWKAYGLMNPQCSICHKYNIEKSRFCPNCGARMDGGAE